MADTKAPDGKSPLAVARDITFVAVIYLFFAGYVYFTQLYADFGIDRTGDSGSLNQIVSYSFIVFLTHSHACKMALYVLIIAYILYSYAGSRQWSPRRLSLMRNVAVAVCAFFAFPIIFGWAQESADSAARDFYENGQDQTIEILLNGSAVSKYDKSFRDLNRQFRLRPVWESPQAYYVLRPATGSSPQNIYAVQKSDVRLAITQNKKPATAPPPAPFWLALPAAIKHVVWD